MAVLNGTNLSLFDHVNQEIRSDKEDQEFWWDVFGRPLATLLKTSQYGEEEQLYYLRWFHQWIMPSLGPRPVNGEPHYVPSLTYDGSPVEYSLNWKEKKVNQTIRFTTEPCSRKAGTAADPLNQLAAKDLLVAMAKDISGIDLTRFNLFLSETHVPDEVADEAVSKLPPGVPRARTWIAYDLERGSMVVKAYFNPGLKALQEGTPTNKLVFDAIRKCNGPAGSYDKPIEVLNSYLKMFDGSEAPHIGLLSNDCVVDSPTSRVKVYVVAFVNTLAKARDVFHLGGRLSGTDIAKGLKAVSDFWCHLFGLNNSGPDIDDKEVLAAGSRCFFVFEMRPTAEGQKEADIEVKWHMPASWLGQTDAQICEVLSTWFRNYGHSDLAVRYQRDLMSAL